MHTAFTHLLLFIARGKTLQRILIVTVSMAQSLMKHHRFTSIPVAIGYEEALLQTTKILITPGFVTALHTQ